MNQKPNTFHKSPYMKIDSCTGFTIVEALISMLLLAIVLAGGIAFYFSTSNLTALQSHKRMATGLAGSTLEAIRHAGYVSLTGVAGTDLTDAAIAGVSLPSLLIGDWTYTRTYDISDVDVEPDGTTDFKEVTVNVIWTEAWQNDPTEVNLRTYIVP